MTRGRHARPSRPGRRQAGTVLMGLLVVAVAIIGIVAVTSHHNQETAVGTDGGGSATSVATSASSTARGGSSSSTTRPNSAPSDTAAVGTGTSQPTAPADSTNAADLAGKVVVIDPGHDGGNGAHPDEINRQVDAGGFTKECDTTGTQTNDGYPEHAFTWDVSQRLATALRAQGATVFLTRANDSGVGPCVNERAAIGNEHHADVAISIHADGGPPDGRGFHVLTPAGGPGRNNGIIGPSATFGNDLRDAFRADTAMPTSTYLGTDGIYPRSDLGGLNLSNVPKVFIECGNMRNATDAALLEDPNFRQQAAQAIAGGIDTYLAGD